MRLKHGSNLFGLFISQFEIARHAPHQALAKLARRRVGLFKTILDDQRRAARTNHNAAHQKHSTHQ